MTDHRPGLARVLAFVVALAIVAPSVGDFGLTFDEPAYRHSQTVSIHWWQRLARGESSAITTPDALLFYWPYARFGVNFHPPLAGQLNLLTYGLFGGVMKDIPARRMASVLEFSLTVAILYGFMARRYGTWTGIVSAGSLLFMPRLFGQAHLIDTDTPGLLLWTASACVFWKALHDPGGSRWWGPVLGLLVGLSFVEKMGTVLVILPILLWMAVATIPRSLAGRDGAAWRDGLISSALMLAPLGLAYREMRRLEIALLTSQSRLGIAASKLSPSRTDLFRDRPETWLPGAILLAPLIVWLLRRLILRLFAAPRDRPALEIWLAVLGIAPAVAWLGNPAWWRETLPRLAHYHAINTTRQGILPDIRNMYLGETYLYSLPWHNAWVLIAVTVPATVLIASMIGLALAPWRDRLPAFFLLNALTLPAMRMLPTPAHDGVRLFLPSFAFLAAFAGWGAAGLARSFPGRWARPAVAAVVLAPAAWGLARVHPYELSYYNELIGGPRGAWGAGFELSYWYDALTPSALDDLGRRLPSRAEVMFASPATNPIMVLQDDLALGALRNDVELVDVDSLALTGRSFPFVILLTHDSKADAFSRILFAMDPWYAVAPRQLDGLRVLTVADPAAASRAWALQLLLDDRDRPPPEPPRAPIWVRRHAPLLARFWGDGVQKAPRPALHAEALDWAAEDPRSLLAAARSIADRRSDAGADRLKAILDRYPDRASFLLRARPEAVVEAVNILARRPDALRTIVLRQGFTDPATVGGSLDSRGE